MSYPFLGKTGSFETENNYCIISISNAGIVQVQCYAGVRSPIVYNVYSLQKPGRFDADISTIQLVSQLDRQYTYLCLICILHIIINGVSIVLCLIFATKIEHNISGTQQKYDLGPGGPGPDLESGLDRSANHAPDLDPNLLEGKSIFFLKKNILDIFEFQDSPLFKKSIQ